MADTGATASAEMPMVPTALDFPDCRPCQMWGDAGASWPRPCAQHYGGEPPKNLAFAMSSIIFPSVAEAVHTLNPLQTKENSRPPFETMESSAQQREGTMAAGVMPAPGTEYGPCEGKCGHTDCASSRATAAEPCNYCKQPIGYETPFYREEDDDQGAQTFAHAICALEAVGQ